MRRNSSDFIASTIAQCNGTAETRTVLQHLSKISENAGRYEELCLIMKELVQLGGGLGDDDRERFARAYKHVIGEMRAAFQTLGEEKTFAVALEDYKGVLRAELAETCTEALGLLKNHLLVSSKSANLNTDAQVFYMTMAADLHRYMAQTLASPKTDVHEREAKDYYRNAFDLACAHLNPTNSIRLGLALNYAVFHFEVSGDQKNALDLAEKAFNDAIKAMDVLEEDDYEVTTLLMQLLRDNVTLWNIEPKP